MGDQLRVGLGVAHLEDVELHLLAGELFQVAANPLSLSAVATDHDARSCGEDVYADAVTGALDLDRGDAGPLQTLGQHPADLDIFADVIGVELVGVPPGLPVGGDTQPKAVGVDLLAHYCEPPFASLEASVLGVAFLAAALLPCARRDRAALAEAPALLLLCGRLSTITVMWLVRLRIR